jgi:uncharacterized protein
VIDATALVPGSAKGAPFRLKVPLSFWGGYDSTTGKVMDRHHPDHGALLTGRVVMMERGRGSSSGSSVLAEAIRAGTAPAALLLRERDSIIVTGAIVAAELYGLSCPVVLVHSDKEWEALAAAAVIAVECAGEKARVAVFA